MCITTTDLAPNLISSYPFKVKEHKTGYLELTMETRLDLNSRDLPAS